MEPTVDLFETKITYSREAHVRLKMRAAKERRTVAEVIREALERAALVPLDEQLAAVRETAERKS